MNLRLSPIKNSRSRRRNKVMSYLHQCKQCGVLFECIGKAASAAVGEFSWDKKFMVDKCDTCKSFRVYDIY
jgi:hypothetical protein